MKKNIFFILIILLISFIVFGFFLYQHSNSTNKQTNSIEAEKEALDLTPAEYEGASLEKTLKERRSIREYSTKPVSKENLSQLLWAAQGITDQKRDFRTAPSAGALYPLEIYIDVKNVEGLDKGVYKYEPEEHKIKKVLKNSQRDQIYQAALRQNHIKDSPLLLIFTGVYERVTQKYDEEGVKYIHIEVGHAAQNIYLQATSLGLGTVSVGAFNEKEIKKVLGIKEAPLYLMPVGNPKTY